MATPEDVRDILDTRREFIIETEGKTTSYFIANPSGEDIRKADWQYSKIYNQAILDDLLTQAQMVDLLKKQGIISEEYATEVEVVRASLAAEIYKLENLPDSTPDLEREDAALSVAATRDELFRLNQRVNGPMGNTCENISEDARVEYLTSRIVQNKDGSKLWEDFDAYRNEENTALSVKARFEVMLWMQGLNSDFLENTPEQMALREVNQKRVEQALASLKEEREGAEEEEFPEETETEILELPEAAEEPKEVEEVKAEIVEELSDETPKKKRGRPKGSKNKKAPKPAPEPEPVPEPELQEDEEDPEPEPDEGS
jgi:hypothetical protein